MVFDEISRTKNVKECNIWDEITVLTLSENYSTKWTLRESILQSDPFSNATDRGVAALYENANLARVAGLGETLRGRE